MIHDPARRWRRRAHSLLMAALTFAAASLAAHWAWSKVAVAAFGLPPITFSDALAVVVAVAALAACGGAARRAVSPPAGE